MNTGHISQELFMKTIHKSEMKNKGANHIIDFYPRQRFSCRRCGFCCRLEIKITPDEVNRLKKTMLPSGQYPPAEWFITAPSQPSLFIAAKRENGECVFRDDSGGCVLHELNAKPLICRVFPLHVVNWEDGHCSADLRFICPGVGDASGVLLEHQPEIITGIAVPLKERLALGNTGYSDKNPAALTAVYRVHAGYRAILHDETIPLKLRLYTLSRIIDFHADKDNYNAIRAADAGFAADAMDFTRKAASTLSTELSKGIASLREIIDFRILITVYLRNDDPLTARSLWRRLKILCAHSMFAAGGGNLSRINPHSPDTNGRQCLAAPGKLQMNEAAKEIFQQFLYGKLDSMHFCGSMVNGLSYEMGMRHLLLSVPVTFTVAAAFARTSKRTVIGVDEMLAAVRLLDLTFGRSPFLQLKLTGKLLVRLSRPATFAGILNLISSIK
jgi:Fe-S-cluster containining protein